MATRFYFPLSTTTNIAPTPDAFWDYISEVTRGELAIVKGTSAITVGTQIGPWTSNTQALDRQYISQPLVIGTVFTTAQTVRGQLMVREYAGTDNVIDVFMRVRIVSYDGNTVRVALNN